jgi:hypothetical protein
LCGDINHPRVLWRAFFGNHLHPVIVKDDWKFWRFLMSKLKNSDRFYYPIINGEDLSTDDHPGDHTQKQHRQD